MVTNIMPIQSASNPSWAYILLGYSVQNFDIGRLYRYVVSEEYVGRARALLQTDQIPHAIRRWQGRSGLEIIVTDRSENLENALSLSPPMEVTKVDASVASALLSSSVRLRFIECGWRRGVGKLYSDRRVRESVAGDNAKLYDAVRLAADYLNSGRLILFVDYAIKAEFVTSLDQLSEWVIERITWVKLKGLSWSFHVVEKAFEYEDEPSLLKKLEKTLSKFTGEEVKLASAGNTVYVKPHSVSLNDFLKKELSGLRIDERDGRVLIPMPQSSLVPVASMDNLSLFGELPTFTVGPRIRRLRVQEIAEDVGLDSLEYRGLKAQIDTRRTVELDSRDYHLELNPQSTYVKMEFKEARPSSWRPVFEPGKRRCCILIKLLEGKGGFSGGYYGEYTRACRILIDRFSSALRSMVGEDQNLAIVTLTDGPGLERLSEELSRAVSYDVVYTVLLYDERADTQGTLIGRYEYLVASKGGYPHVVDVGMIIQDVRKRRSEISDRIGSVVMSVLKDLAVRTGDHPFRLSPPSGFEDCLIAGVDATVMTIKSGYLYAATTIVVLDPSGRYKVKFSGFGGSDVDALVNVVENIARDPELSGKRLLIIVNRSSLRPVLRRTDISSFLRDGVILTSASKTHSYSRILKSSPKLGVVNVDRRDIGLLAKLGQVLVESGSRKSVVSRYLAVTTSHPGGESWTVGTIRPVLLNVAGDVDHLRAAEFLVALAHFARVSAYWSPSLPWPVHKANKLSRKVHRIVNAMSSAGGIVVPTEDVLQRL